MPDFDSGIVRTRIKRRVSVAALVIDDFSGELLKGQSVTVCADSPVNKPIRKNDGFFVFLNYDKPVIKIEAEAPFYDKETIEAEIESLDPANPVIKIRLRPNRLYPAPSGTTLIEGTAAPNSELRIINVDGGRPLKLLYEYEKRARTISLFTPDGANIEGRTFAICAAEWDYEIFTLSEAVDISEGTYKLLEPLKKGYKKSASKMYEVYTVKTGADGAFFLPVRSAYDKDFTCRVEMSAKKGGKKSVKEIVLKAGKTNTVNI